MSRRSNKICQKLIDTAKDKIKLVSSDGELFEVERGILYSSSTLRNMMEVIDVSPDDDDPVPIMRVTGSILKRILQWATYHRMDVSNQDNPEDDSKEKRSDDISAWDAEFLKVDQGTLFEILLGANYLGMDELLDSACKTVANQIRGKGPEEIRKTFNIQNDFTPEEEAEVRLENQWCEEK